MKFCPVVPEICRGQVHVPKKERRIKRRKRRIIIIIRRNGAKTISLPNKDLIMFRGEDTNVKDYAKQTDLK